MIDTVEKFIKAVEYMRECQKMYYKSYTALNKQKMQEAEKVVDKAISDRRKRKMEELKNQQQELFQ